MYLIFPDKQSFTIQSGMSLTFTDINNILFHISTNYKQRFFMSSDIHSFSLTDSKKMCTVMSSDYMSLTKVHI